MRTIPHRIPWMVVCVLLIGSVWTGSMAHEKHKPKSKPPSGQTAPVDRETTRVGTAATKSAPAVAVVQEEPAGEPESPVPAEAWSIPWREALFGHLHNKIIHFPLALGVVGAILLLAGYRWPQYRSAARLLILIAAICAIVAYFTGKAQEAAFEESELETILEWHETMGISTAILLWIGVVMDRIPPLRRWQWVWALLLLVALSVTGFLGGMLAHTG